jgi:phosphoglycolate phosphatase
VFDLDGTLIDSTGDLAEAVNRTLARLAPGTAGLDRSVVRRLVGNGARVLVERSLREAGVTAAVDDALAIFQDCYRSCLLDTTRLYPGVAEGIALLDGRTLAVLTNKSGDMSRTILAGLGIADRFARIYGGSDLPAPKPDPAGLRLVMRDLGATPEETAMVGDLPVDVQTARTAGVWTVGVTYGFDPVGLSQSGPDRLVNDLRELKGALP